MGELSLVTKWVAIGAGTGLLGIGLVQGIQELATKATPSSAARYTAATYANVPAQLAVPSASAAPMLVPELEPKPAITAEPNPPGPVPVPSPAGVSVAPTATAAPEPKDDAPPAASDAGVADPPASDRRSTLTRELSLLEQARRALSQHAARSALQTLAGYRAEFPHGSMHVEAAALRVEAVEQAGDRALAQRLAQSFLDSFPASPLAARVRAISEVTNAGAGEQKP